MIFTFQGYTTYKDVVNFIEARCKSIISQKPDYKIVDLGSGGYPFEYANILIDKYIQDNYHRGKELVIPDGKKFIQADAKNLHFRDKEVDFINCRHIFEHFENPEKACKEIIRVAKSGYIETPTPLWELLFGRPPDKHRWIIEVKNNKIVFTKNTFNRPFGDFFDRLFKENKEFQSLWWENYKLFVNCIYFTDFFEFTISNKGDNYSNNKEINRNESN